MRRILHELQRRQVELEMQNEELRRIWDGIELSPNKYLELYDFSPVGYFTFDAHGVIREVNLAGAQLLGIEKRLLANKPFFSFIADADDRNIFSNHLASALQMQGMHRCEIRLTRNDGTVAYWQLQSVAVETIENMGVYVLTSIVDGTFGKHFREELRNANDKLELTVNERIEELTRAMMFLADLYRFLGHPHTNHQKAPSMPQSNGGVDRLNGAAIGPDGNPEESTQSPTATGLRNFSFFPIKRGINRRLYGLCAIAVIAAVSFVLLQPKGKTTSPEQKKTGKNMVRSFGLQTSSRKMNQENNSSAVVQSKVSPQGVIYIDGEKKGVAPILRELQAKKGKYTVTNKSKNHKAYRSVVKRAPQDNFRKSTATAIKKNITVSKTSIMRLSNSLVRAWVRIEYYPYSIIKAQEKKGLPTQGYDKFSHTLVLSEYDCKNRTYRSMQINDYDTNGKVLWSSPVSKGTRQPIVPGSVGETLYKIVCQGS